MKTLFLSPAALCGILFLVSGASAQAGDDGHPGAGVGLAPPAPGVEESSAKTASTDLAEVELLKRRVEELERQNHALADALVDVKKQVDRLALPAVAVAAATPAPSAPQTAEPAPVQWSEIIGAGNRIKVYGFVRLDLIGDSQRPNNAQSIQFVTSPDPRAGMGDDGNFELHPRLTRFGIDFTGPEIDAFGNARLTGKLETDFQNGGANESRQAIRIRHAYLNLGWNEFSILAGQTWDVVSPLFPTVNSDTLQWNAGNTGDRRPQLRVTYEPEVGGGKLQLAAAIGLTGAVDPLDLDANGVRDGEASARPNLQGRLGYSHALGAKDRVASVGVSGFYGFLHLQNPVAGEDDYRSQLANVDLAVPVLARLTLRGEGWWGRNLSDVRGGITQGVNTETGQEIRSRGGWAEAGFRLSRYLTGPGFSTDDPRDEDLPNGGRTRNRAFYLANRIPVSPNFTVGADFLRWRTDYKGFERGVDNRVNLFLQYSF